MHEADDASEDGCVDEHHTATIPERVLKPSGVT